MNKDVIYIDVDDDVTAIIGKIKKAKEKVIALVPPKRTGALQSAVNLRLIDRMVKVEKKHLVLITNNQALIALAANASIPVAKNLQSKPEVAEIPALAVDEGDDIIDGADLPVGDHAKSVKVSDNTQEKTESRSDVIDDMDIDGEQVASAASVGVAGAVSKKVAAARSKVKIPDFDKFRKRLFLGIGGGVLLVALLIWMFVFAPAATIVVTAKTSPAPVSATVKLGGTAATDYKTGVVKSVSQQDKKDESVEFDATGQKDIGDKAKGTLRISKLTQTDLTVPAGSRFTTSSGLVFTTDQAATIPASEACFPSFCAKSVDVSVTAEKAGTNYNGISGTASGPNGTSGTFQGSTAGGSSKVAKVVSADDIERAKGQLIGKSTDEEKKALAAKFTNGEKVIDSSFTIDRADAVSAPTVDQEAPANGKAKLTIATTYTLYAVPKVELDNYLTSSVKTQLTNENSQRVYNTGIDKATLSNFKKDGDTLTATVTSTGQIGPKIDEAAVKESVKGKIYGEVQSTLQAINGVQDVDVKFSFFWVRSVPNDTNKIHIEFKLENES